MPVAILTELVSGDVYQWGALMAGSLLGSLPVAIFYSLLVDYYVSSLTGRGEGTIISEGVLTRFFCSITGRMESRAQPPWWDENESA